MTVEDVRDYEKKMQEETNIKVLSAGADGVVLQTDGDEDKKEEPNQSFQPREKSGANSPVAESPNADDNPANPVLAAAAGIRSWLSWS